MKRIKIIIGGVMVLLIVLGIVAFIKMGASTSSSDSDDESAPENVTSVATVQVGALTNVTLHHYVDGYGIVEAAPATADQPAAGGALVAPTSGIVSKVNVAPGQQVKQGDLLMTVGFGRRRHSITRRWKLPATPERFVRAPENTSLKKFAGCGSAARFT